MRFSLFRTVPVSRVLGRLKSEAPVYWETLKTVNKSAFQAKIASLNNWYTKFLHLDEVKMYQDRVVALQERLLEAQEKRREIGQNLAEIRKKSNLLQDEIHKVKRSENIERFLDLMKEETEVLSQEREVSRMFQEYDRAERELFTAFTNAVRDSHEKQRAQLEYTKYFGIILSIAGSFLAFCYTTFKKDDLKKFIEDSLKQAPKTSDNSEVINFVQSETMRLSEMINFKQNEVALLLEKENERKNKQFLYYLGAGALLLLLMKTSN